MATIATETGLTDLNFQSEHLDTATITRTVDFSKIATGGVPLLAASSDTYNVLTIPANFVVEDVYLTTVLQGTASSVLSVGDTADAAYYFAAGTTAPASDTGTIVNTGTVAGASGKFGDVTSVTTYALRMKKAYATASLLTFTLGGANAPVSGKLKFSVRGFYLV